ncbi:MAG TPA: aminopeptidase P N-terminal domain-containing protein, partial [Rhizobacter sp.]|nr:aminopeptidase P N-terminal domain-containing protein [Rhizobacter sp.]
MNPALYRQRRLQLASRMRAEGGGIAVLATAPEHTRNGDTLFPFRHDSYFHYLTGFDEPESWLLLHADGRSVLFCRPKNPGRETWEGVNLGPQAAPAVLGVDEAQAIDQLADSLRQCVPQQPPLWLLSAAPSRHDVRLLDALKAGAAEANVQRDLTPLLNDMRLFKDAQELSTMRHAAAISARAHVRAMRFCAQRFADAPAAGVHEYEIEAEVLHEFRRLGAQSPAYPCVVAAGANACTLHHAAGTAALHAGELCLIDAGCELDGYASDITRTFPANGRFSSAQRELYDIVVAAQQAALAATRPGARQRDAHHAAVRVLAQGMLDTGLLPRPQHDGVDAVIASGAYKQFFMHATSHWLGRDVHDVGEYDALDEAQVEQPDGLGGMERKHPTRRLQPGMVMTLEPGLYVRPSPSVPERYWNIGIR